MSSKLILRAKKSNCILSSKYCSLYKSSLCVHESLSSSRPAIPLLTACLAGLFNILAPLLPLHCHRLVYHDALLSLMHLTSLPKPSSQLKTRQHHLSRAFFARVPQSSSFVCPRSCQKFSHRVAAINGLPRSGESKTTNDCSRVKGDSLFAKHPVYLDHLLKAHSAAVPPSARVVPDTRPRTMRVTTDCCQLSRSTASEYIMSGLNVTIVYSGHHLSSPRTLVSMPSTCFRNRYSGSTTRDDISL